MEWGARSEGCFGDSRNRQRAARWQSRRSARVTRMLCTECRHMGEPDTVLEGSDRVELAGWCLLAVPGLLYCGWRHLNRFKVCPRCGSNAWSLP